MPGRRVVFLFLVEGHLVVNISRGQVVMLARQINPINSPPYLKICEEAVILALDTSDVTLRGGGTFGRQPNKICF